MLLLQLLASYSRLPVCSWPFFDWSRRNDHTHFTSLLLLPGHNYYSCLSLTALCLSWRVGPCSPCLALCTRSIWVPIPFSFSSSFSTLFSSSCTACVHTSFFSLSPFLSFLSFLSFFYSLGPSPLLLLHLRGTLGTHTLSDQCQQNSSHVLTTTTTTTTAFRVLFLLVSSKKIGRLFNLFADSLTQELVAGYSLTHSPTRPLIQSVSISRSPLPSAWPGHKWSASATTAQCSAKCPFAHLHNMQTRRRQCDRPFPNLSLLAEHNHLHTLTVCMVTQKLML